MRLYHFLKAEYGISAIKDCRLKVARLAELNDPFEGFHTDTGNYMSQFLLKERRRVANQRHGVLCFSKDYRNPVQWAHYADSHRGFCLGFEVTEDDLIEVDYVNGRSSLAELISVIDIPPREFLRFMLSRKYSHWSYEKEVRKIVPIPLKSKEPVFYNFKESIRLTDVVIGCRNTAPMKSIRSILRAYSPAPRVIRVRPSASAFEMQEC